MSLLHQTASIQDDQHSRSVAATALAAVVPAWLSAGKDVAALWSTVVEALPEVPAHRRLGLLSSLMHAMPQKVSTGAQVPVSSLVACSRVGCYFAYLA